MSTLAVPSGPSGLRIIPDMPICQTDLPLDWYQPEFRPYAEEYLALPDRLPRTVLPWMDSYMKPALERLGDSVELLAHYYMGGEIVKLVERYGGRVADSYELALRTRDAPHRTTFVESAVHFMAESIAILAAEHQAVWITNPKSGCTMEMMAKEWMIQPAFDLLRERFGDELLVVAYMNTSGRVKALAGQTGGAVCTSSNAQAIVRWALEQGKRIFFVPDRHLGENVAAQANVHGDDLFVWERTAATTRGPVPAWPRAEQGRLDRARMILWDGFCGVHTVFRPEHVRHWKRAGYRVIAHPECPKDVVDLADGAGSTKFLWGEVMAATKGMKLAIATEGHFVRNAKEQAALRGAEVVNVADAPDSGAMGCGCATMSRNDPPHLVALVDLLSRGAAPDLNSVLPGDVVSETTAARERLGDADRETLVRQARAALERMIDVTRAAKD